MNKIKYILAIGGLAFTACDLDVMPETRLTSGNFPSSEAQAEKMVTGIYSVMNDAVSDPESCPFYVYELLSDDRLGGGSASSKKAQCADRLVNTGLDWFGKFWEDAYKGIHRANLFIETVDNVKSWKSADKREQLLGEAYFLRAFYYLDLVQMFGEVPLITSSDTDNAPRDSEESIYAQITSDLLKAINLLPSAPFENMAKGHATKWAAEALLAREFLFYTGFYSKEALPANGGKTVSSTEVIDYLEDCIKNSGHKLLTDQRNLWPYTNPYTAKDYVYTTDTDGKVLSWVNYAGDNNVECLFSLNFSNVNSGGGYANRIVEFFNLRLTSDFTSFPFIPQGYSNGFVNRKLWDDWAADPDYAGDYRLKGSICDRTVEMPDYKGDNTKEMENTTLHAKKYLGCGAYDGETRRGSYAYFYGGQENNQRGLTQAIILIRYADVLLMHAELTNGKTVPGAAKNGLNLVRERANLTDIAYSLPALKKERRFELCFEGLRWNDLRRWGNVEEIEKNQEGVAIQNKTKMSTYTFGSTTFMSRYNATKGFWKIPESQVTLSNGVMTQNAGWDADSEFISLPYN